MLVFKERGKPEYPEKNLSEQGREPTTNSTHKWRRRQDSNPGHISILQPAKTAVSPHYSPLGTLATEICLILICLLVDYDKVLCSSANEHQQNSNASSKEMNIIHEY